jgi:hypothetical protein
MRPRGMGYQLVLLQVQRGGSSHFQPLVGDGCVRYRVDLLADDFLLGRLSSSTTCSLRDRRLVYEPEIGAAGCLDGGGGRDDKSRCQAARPRSDEACREALECQKKPSSELRSDLHLHSADIWSISARLDTSEFPTSTSSTTPTKRSNSTSGALFCMGRLRLLFLLGGLTSSVAPIFRPTLVFILRILSFLALRLSYIKRDPSSRSPDSQIPSHRDSRPATSSGREVKRVRNEREQA